MSAPKVLIVDDDIQVRDLLRIIFIAEDYTVEAVATGPEAVDKIAYNGIDLVVLDLMMPGMSGLDVLRHLPEHHAPVIVLSALNDHSTSEAAVEQGAAAVLRKPFAVLELLEIARGLVDAARAERWIEPTKEYP